MHRETQATLLCLIFVAAAGAHCSGSGDGEPSGDTDPSTDGSGDSETQGDTDSTPETSKCDDVDPFDSASCQQTATPSPCRVLVDPQAADQRDGATWSTAFSTVQDGIDAAHCAYLENGNPCEVWVKGGVYNIFRGCPYDTVRLRTGVHLYGGFSGTEATREERDPAANETILLGGKSQGDHVDAVYHVVLGADSALIDGFTIKNGTARHPAFNAANSTGGGMLNDGVSVDISNCRFIDNVATSGGAIAWFNASGKVTDCVFENGSTWEGGALRIDSSEVTIVRCSFTSNWSAQWGGAVYVQSGAMTVEESTFRENNCTGGPGGAIFAIDATLELSSTAFDANEAAYLSGGAITTIDSTLTLRGCRFTANSAPAGGAVAATTATQGIVENCLFDSNTATQMGGAISVREDTTLDVTNSTFFANEAAKGGASISSVYSAEILTVTNSILWGGSSDELLLDPDSRVTISHCTVAQELEAVENMVVSHVTSLDPMLADPHDGDFTLDPSSPCIDAADGDLAPTTDIDDRERIDIGSVPNTGTGDPDYADIGAFEFEE